MAYNDWATRVTFSPDGKYLVSGGCEQWAKSLCIQGSARVWDANTGKKIAYMIHEGDVNSVAFSPNGKYVVSASDDKTARVWNASTGKEIARITYDGKVNSVAFSQDGKYVVSGSDDKTARLWDAETGREFPYVLSDNREVESVAFSPDGEYVALGEIDQQKSSNYISECLQGIISVWDIATGQKIALITYPAVCHVRSIVFSLDGKYVVSGDDQDSVRIWVYRPDDLISAACLRVTRNLTRTEWTQYIGDALPYQAVCPNLPIEPESTPSPAATPVP
jgi:WD40 repeat protein